MTPLEAAVLRIADGYVNEIRETARNDHPKIREWWPLCGIKAPCPWCALAVCGVIYEAGMSVGVLPKFRRSASVHSLGRLNESRRLDPQEALQLLAAGIPCVLLHDSGGGLGHAGIGFGYDPKTGVVKTYEGNSNAAGSREGDSYVSKERPASYWDLGALKIG
jgi:hypothetical protein